MKDFQSLHRFPDWYRSSGSHGDVVISSRVRLSRNLATHLFPHLLSEEGALELRHHITEVFQDLPEIDGLLRYDWEELSADQGGLLGEEGLLEPEGGARGVSIFAFPQQDLWVKINMGDHLQLLSLRGGLELNQAWKEADHLDSQLEEVLDYAVSPEWGYLSPEMDNLGPAMGASTLVHLPATVIVGGDKKVAEIVGGKKRRIRPFFSGDEAPGDLFLLSQGSEIGVSEGEILEKLEEITLSLLHYEREMRSFLFEKKRDFLEDQVCRALGVLERARFLRWDEAVKLLSLVRMGSVMDCAASVDHNRVTALLFQSGPAHVRMRLEEGAPEEERENGERANWIRSVLEDSSA